MKKGFAITLLLLCAMVSHAWLVPSGSPSESEDFMMSATVDEMECAIDVQGCSFVADLTAAPGLVRPACRMRKGACCVNRLPF